MKILLKSLEVCSFSVLRAEVAPVDLTTLSSLRADRTLKTVEKINAIYFVERPFRHFVRVDVQNCGKVQILGLAERRFRHFVRVGRSKLW